MTKPAKKPKPEAPRIEATWHTPEPERKPDEILKDIEGFFRKAYPRAARVEVLLDNRGMRVGAVYEKPMIHHAVWGLDGVEQFPPKEPEESGTWTVDIKGTVSPDE